MGVYLLHYYLNVRSGKYTVTMETASFIIKVVIIALDDNYIIMEAFWQKYCALQAKKGRGMHYGVYSTVLDV